MYIHFTEYADHNEHMQIQELGAQPISFPGFTMAVFDLPDGKTNDEWNTQVHVHVTSFFDCACLRTETQG